MIQEKLVAMLRAMIETMLRDEPLGVAQLYTDNALLTDLKEFRVDVYSPLRFEPQQA